MACDFCRHSDFNSVNPCPICTPSAHSGNTVIRKAPKRAPKQTANNGPKWPRPSGFYNAPAPRTPAPAAARPILRPVPSYTAPIVAQKPPQRVSPLLGMPVVVLNSAGKPGTPRASPPMVPFRSLFALAYPGLPKVPKQIEGTCRPTPPQGECTTLPPIAVGDWAGLARAVEAGILTHQGAVDLAQSWNDALRAKAVRS